MKKIGIVGGLSSESTIKYYEHINRKCFEKKGVYPEIIIYSENIQKFIEWTNKKQLDKIKEKFIKDLNILKEAGADFGLIVSNTAHKYFEEVQKYSPIPLINIIDSTIEEIRKENIKTVGLLGTKITMSENFYKDKLLENGIKVIVPEINEQEFIDKIIFDELVRGKINLDSKKVFLEIINKLKEKGAGGIILGCTEIPLLINQNDCDIKLFDTTIIHAEKAVEYTLKD